MQDTQATSSLKKIHLGYGQIRDTAAGVQHTRRDQRLRRTGLDAPRAHAALVEGRLVGRKRQAADNLGEEDERPKLGVDHAAVLADPADSGILREDPLLHRPGVHVRGGLERSGIHLVHPGNQPIHPPHQHVVVALVIAVPGHVHAALAICRNGREPIVRRRGVPAPNPRELNPGWQQQPMSVVREPLLRRGSAR